MNIKNKFITCIPYIGYTIGILLIGQTVALAKVNEIDKVSIDKQELAANTQIKDIQKIDYLDKEKLITIVVNKSLSDQIPKHIDKRCPQWEYKFIEFGLPVELFSYIAWRESGCNEKAINAKYDKSGNVIWTLNKNGSIDRGLVQINSCWKSLTKQICKTSLDGLLDVNCNLKVAKYLYDIDGAKPWGFK